MIVIAIIGILAAALFPSLTAYLRRSRDAARVSHMKDTTTAVWAYYSDNEKYPTGTGCVDAAILSTNYFEAWVPRDPTDTHENGCGSNGFYGFSSGTGYATAPQFITTAIFENDNGGNFSNTGGTQVTSLIGTGIFYLPQRTALDVSGVVRKWNGSGYIMYK